MVDKYLKHVAGTLTEQAALAVSAGAADAGKIPALDTTGRLDESMMPVGFGEGGESITVPASEALSGGNFVNIWTVGGIAKARKADASVAGKEANGFVLDPAADGDPAVVHQPSRLNNALTGLTPGAVYFLSPTTPGTVTTVCPVGSGQLVQRLGRASSDTELTFNPSDPIVLA